MGQENYYAVINLPPRLIPEAPACLHQDQPMGVLPLMLHQNQAEESTFKNPAWWCGAYSRALRENERLIVEALRRSRGI